MVNQSDVFAYRSEEVQIGVGEKLELGCVWTNLRSIETKIDIRVQTRNHETDMSSEF